MIALRIFLLLSCVTGLIIPQVQGVNPVQGNNQAQTKTGSKGPVTSGSKYTSRKPAITLSNKKYIEHENVIPYQYIVRMKSGLSDQQAQMHMNQVNKLQQTAVSKYPKSHPFFNATANFEGAPSTGGILTTFNASETLRLYLGYFVDEVLSDLKTNTLVAAIEQVPQPLQQDTAIQSSTTAAKSTKPSKPKNTINKRTNTQFLYQRNAPWHLSRINSVASTSDRGFYYYKYAGLNVDIYTIDSGVYEYHKDIVSRVTNYCHRTVIGNHGTCAASVAGGTEYGVAKEANLISLFVNFKSQNFLSNMLEHLNFIAESHVHNLRTSSKFQGSVVNLSLKMQYLDQFEVILSYLSDIGVHAVASAGNFNYNDPYKDSCTLYPASSIFILTVGATNQNDEISWFSGRGLCVDLYAPGENIKCASDQSRTATEIVMGTSFSAPIVSGIVASLLSYAPEFGSGFNGNNQFSPQEMRYLIIPTLAAQYRAPGSITIAYLGNSQTTYNEAYGIAPGLSN